MKSIYQRTLTLTALAVMLAHSAHAAENQESTQPSYMAPELIISGQKGDVLQHVVGKESVVLNPSQMSVYKAINLMPSLSQQSVDPYGLADIVNYHESFRFRGIEATSGGVPATTVNVEGLPVTGRPGGGATIYDLENFSSLNINTGVMPAHVGLGLADVGGKISMEIRKPEEQFGVQLKQGIGSDSFKRSYLRIDSGDLGDGLKSFASVSNSNADKWKGEGDSERNNVMMGLAKPLGKNVTLETYLTWSKGNIHTYKPLSYTQLSDLDGSYKSDYGTNPNSYDYFDYNRNEFEDWMLMANLSIKTGEQSTLTIKPYYWSDKGYYLETITLANGQNRIRRWDIDHDLSGILSEFSTNVADVDLRLGYLYHTQERPGPPNSWKTYKVVNGALVFDTWSILSNPSRHELHSPYMDATWRFGSYQLEAGAKFINYTLPSIVTYQTTGIGDVAHADALALQPTLDTFASASDTKSFSRVFPNLTLTHFVSDNLTLHAAYGENYVTHVDIYPYFISQRALFAAKNISFQKLWNAREMETSRNVEFGMHVNGSNWSMTPTLYYAKHINKQAVLYDPALNATYPMNNAEATGYGFELEADYKPSNAFKWYGSFAWNRFYYAQDIYSEGGSLIDVKGEQVPDAPEFLAKSMVSWKVGDVTLSPIVRYSSTRYGDVLHKEKIDANTLCDFDITWSKALAGLKQVDCSLSFMNIFDERYVSMISTSDYKTLKTSYQPGAPFTVVASVALHY
uniref:TonB-dependent receptor, putative n=1 Tax=Chlorobium chlorochromatii (strain CaD3) TaxID=340177 RepID=Q3AR61_CHLCH